MRVANAAYALCTRRRLGRLFVPLDSLLGCFIKKISERSKAFSGFSDKKARAAARRAVRGVFSAGAWVSGRAKGVI